MNVSHINSQRALRRVKLLDVEFDDITEEEVHSNVNFRKKHSILQEEQEYLYER